jgi:hypothetical protein
MVWTMVA